MSAFHDFLSTAMPVCAIRWPAKAAVLWEAPLVGSNAGPLQNRPLPYKSTTFASHGNCCTALHSNPPDYFLEGWMKRTRHYSSARPTIRGERAATLGQAHEKSLHWRRCHRTTHPEGRGLKNSDSAHRSQKIVVPSRRNLASPRGRLGYGPTI